MSEWVTSSDQKTDARNAHAREHLHNVMKNLEERLVTRRKEFEVAQENYRFLEKEIAVLQEAFNAISGVVQRGAEAEESGPAKRNDYS